MKIVPYRSPDSVPCEVMSGDDAQRTRVVALQLCEVCGLPIEPRSEAEHDAMTQVGVHLGECWQRLKRI